MHKCVVQKLRKITNHRKTPLICVISFVITGSRNSSSQILSHLQSLDLVLEKSDEVRSHMAINGKLPRFLSKMNFALADYDTSFNCDWQAIAIKYVQLSFQVRNLNYWIQATHETSTVPSVSGFLSKRMENAISQHS